VEHNIHTVIASVAKQSQKGLHPMGLPRRPKNLLAMTVGHIPLKRVDEGKMSMHYNPNGKQKTPTAFQLSGFFTGHL